MSKLWELDHHNSVPLYVQLYQQIRQQILTGVLPAGSRLPASRQVARQCLVARVTVTQAYEQLMAEGFVQSKQGAGVFVVAGRGEAPKLEREKATAQPFLTEWGQRVVEMRHGEGEAIKRPEIDFGFGRSFPHIFPYDIWRRLLDRYLSTDDTILSQYGSVAGFGPLREALADYLARQRGVRCTSQQVVIVNGGQQALDIIARLWLSQGDEVLVETPGYVDAFDLFRVHGAKLTALPVDTNGFPVEQIPAKSKAKLAFVTPSNQFPRGGTMPLNRRLDLLCWARQHQALIVEDDYDGELRYNGRPLAALQGLDDEGQVIYLGTFSKVLFPALRLAYVVLPPALVEPFVQAKGLVDRGAPTLMQTAVTDFITEGHFERHLRHLRKEYGRRRQVLVQALETYLPGKVQYATATAGLHIMVYLPTASDEQKLIEQAYEVGVGVYPGSTYHVQKPAPPSILLGFSGLSEAEIEEGVRRIAERCEL